MSVRESIVANSCLRTKQRRGYQLSISSECCAMREKALSQTLQELSGGQ
jgi:hypothetical protein